jgi:Carboxypeptidase regulatory-like domain/TonB dependent receptor
MNLLKSIDKKAWSSWRPALQWLGGVAALFLLSLPAFSQSSNGRILGTVTDQSGGVIAGATVTVVDTERGVTRTLTTDDAGEYNAPNLTPGAYTVRAEARGFNRLERSNVTIQVGQEVRVDLTLQPGEQTQTVTVTEAAPLVETTNATLGGTLNNADINDMPLNGRNYQNLLSLRPGVTVQPGGGPWTQSANGVRPDESGWMLEGVINANFYDSRPIANMPSPFTDGATILPIDAIQEFNLEENPKAEFGWKPGAVVNVGVKSGTNSLHGTAYAFGRDESWAARNAFNPGPVNGACVNPIPNFCDRLPAQLKQFGGVVGGPIKKDKLFFLAGYEGLRSFVGNAIVTGGIPVTDSLGGTNPKLSMVDALQALQTAGVPISPVSLAIAGCPTTLPSTPAGFASYSCTGGLWPQNTGTSKGYTSTFPNTNTSDNGIGKIDYHLNDKHTINGLVLISNYTSLGEDHPFVNPLFEDHAPIRTYTASGNWDWTPNSRMVNEVRFGYDRVNFDFYPADAGTLADGTGYPINTGLTLAGAPGGNGGFPNVNLTGYEKLGTWHNRPFYFHTPYYDGQDNVSYLLGKHAFKFGFETAHIEVDSGSFDTGRGRIDFQGAQTAGLTDCGGVSCPLEDFFAGLPSRGYLLTGDPARVSNWMNYAGFAQDDWRLTSKITVNLGLRYSYVSPVVEANGLFGSFDPTQGMVDQTQLGGSIWKPDHKDFSPRVGFAWDVTGKGTTVVRGGYNLMYSVLTIATLLQEGDLQNSTALAVAAVPSAACNVAVPVGQTCTSAGGQTFGGNNTLAVTKISGSNLNWNGVVFPTGVTTSCTAAAPCNIMAVDPNLKTPYVQAWNFGITHAFTNNLSLETEYVGSHGSRLTGFRDLNQPNSAGVMPYATQFPYLGFVDQLSNDGRSNYDGLQTTLTQRPWHGFSYTLGYTYSHGLDNGSLNRQGFLPQQSLNPGLEYASGDFDIRHRFTFTTSYDIPSVRGHAQMLEGWKLNAIITLQSGQPWTVWDTTNNFDATGSGDNNYRWDFSGNPADFKSQGANSIPYCIGGVCTVNSGVTGQSTTLPNSATLWANCQAKAASAANLASLGCFAEGSSVMTPPATGTFGDMGRNIFRDTGFKNVDFSVFKSFTFSERFNAQFRVEFFNIFNHPNYANPYGSVAGYGVGNDPGGQPNTFGCGCATPDVMAGNPLVGSGSARTMQLGLKLGF